MSGASVSPNALPRLHRLVDSLKQQPEFATRILAAVRAGSLATIDGAVGSSCALAIAALVEATPRHLLVVCPNDQYVDDLLDDVSLFSDASCQRFPAWQTAPGQRLVYDEIYSDRLRTLKALLANGGAQTIICSLPSLLQPVPPPHAVEANSLRLQVGQTIEMDTVARWLAERRFHGVNGVELPGEFSRRGGILDIFAADWQYPARIEWFDNQIESIRSFDVGSQRTTDPLDACDVTVLPSGGDDAMRAAGQHQAQLHDFLDSDLDRFVWLEPQQSRVEATAFAERHAEGELLDIGATHRKFHEFGCVEISSLAAAQHELLHEMSTATVERFSGEFSRVRDELDTAAGDCTVHLICQTEAESQRLVELLESSRLYQEKRLHFHLGRLAHGFHWLREDVIVLSSNQLFRRTVLKRKTKKRLGKRIDSFLDLRENDLVVHLGHGIGRYRGLELLKRDNQVEEHLLIEFHGGTKVYVPSTKIELVQKYVGGNNARVRLATIGGKAWSVRRKAAEAAVQDVAVELLELQAQRAARPGIAFADDSEWQHEFDASFPYEETADQLAAIDAIKQDMRAGRPMDRLLCGDVGFGKTEVAMRAAFKAVDNGYQVALLVPTTILVEQHYQTFRQRISEFPFQIAKLSRFCTAAEQREVVKQLADGAMDIVIGTHRLASRDVQFANLGLLIIDEEQRFGVEIKERLKTLRSTVDILTMTATPIPRTLHMSLTGMRDISNLETAPEDRVAVETRVLRWDEKLIRMAILRELNRGGQVYFVHNRVHDIQRVLAKLADIVPEADIRIGHGQMAAGELEEVMVSFVSGEFDVLLATTIVESGLDIPNANTIFIDTADHYGLADLHQLRGRVGRYKHRAYCYLLVDQHKHLTPEAARRLRAIEEFSEMGAGFAIAMRDLEFRGAGNILGTQQSGHIAAVGYELYCQLLEAAVRKLKKLPPKLALDVNIDLPGDAFLPADYVPDLRMKIDMYRRIARAHSDVDIAALKEELEDRFGPIPPPVQQLLALADLKMDATIWSIHEVRIENQDGVDYLILHYSDDRRMQQLKRDRDMPLRIVDDHTACIPLDPGLSSAEILATVQRALRCEP